MNRMDKMTLEDRAIFDYRRRGVKAFNSALMLFSERQANPHLRDCLVIDFASRLHDGSIECDRYRRRYLAWWGVPEKDQIDAQD